MLNKCDVVGPAHLEVIHDWIGAHFGRVRIVESIQAEVPLEILLDVDRFDPAVLPETHTDHGSCAHITAGGVSTGGPTPPSNRRRWSSCAA